MSGSADLGVELVTQAGDECLDLWIDLFVAKGAGRVAEPHAEGHGLAAGRDLPASIGADEGGVFQVVDARIADQAFDRAPGRVFVDDDGEVPLDRGETGQGGGVGFGRVERQQGVEAQFRRENGNLEIPETQDLLIEHAHLAQFVRLAIRDCPDAGEGVLEPARSVGSGRIDGDACAAAGEGLDEVLDAASQDSPGALTIVERPPGALARDIHEQADGLVFAGGARGVLTEGGGPLEEPHAAGHMHERVLIRLSACQQAGQRARAQDGLSPASFVVDRDGLQARGKEGSGVLRRGETEGYGLVEPACRENAIDLGERPLGFLGVGDADFDSFVQGDLVVAPSACDFLDQVDLAGQVEAEGGDGAADTVARALCSDFERLEEFLARVGGDGDTDQAPGTIRAQVDDGCLRARGALVEDAFAEGAAGEFEDEFGGSLGGFVEGSWVDAPFEAVAGIGADGESTGHRPDDDGVPAGDLEDDIRGAIGDLGGFAADDAGKRLGSFGVGDDEIVGFECAIDAVERSQGLALAGVSDDQRGACEGVEIEDMAGLSVLEGQPVGDIDDVVDGALPDGFEQLDEPRGAGGDLHASDDLCGEARAQIRRVVAQAEVLGDDTDAGRMLQFGLDQAAWAGAASAGGDFTGQPDVAQTIAPIGGDLDIEADIPVGQFGARFDGKARTGEDRVQFVRSDIPGVEVAIDPAKRDIHDEARVAGRIVLAASARIRYQRGRGGAVRVCAQETRRGTTMRRLAMLLAIGLLSGGVLAQALHPVFSDLGVRGGDVFTPELARDGDRVLAGVRIDGRDAVLELRPFSLRSERSRVLVDIGAGELVELEGIETRTYRGWVRGVPGSQVAASVMGMRLRAVVIMPDGTMHAIQEAVRNRAGMHVSYATSAVMPDGGLCANELPGFGLSGGEALPAGDPGPAEVCNLATLIATDSDHDFFLLNGSDVQATIDDVESIINGMDLIYTRDTRVTYLIGDHIVRTDPNDPYTTSDPGALLGQFQDEWNTNQTHIGRDIAHLFTGVDLDGGVIGIAFFNGVCSPTSGYALSQSLWSNTFSLRVGLTAHELGHNWNAMHCNADDDCFIMCSGINGCGGDVTLFGSRSIDTIMNYAATAPCLEDGTAGAPSVPPRANDDTAGSIAGGSILIDVLGNDFEGNCQELLIGAFDTTSELGGTIELSVGTGPEGRDELRYTPPDGVGMGIDTFAYEAADSDGNTSPATVSVILTEWLEPVFDGPVEPGVEVAYYDLSGLGTIREMPDFAQLTPFLEEIVPDVNYPETSGTFAGSGLEDFVGAVFEGVLVVDTEDIYTLFINSSDGSKLYIDGQLVVDNDGLHNMRERDVTFGLRQGMYRFTIEFFENRATAGLVFSWRSNDILKQPVPASALAHALACPADVDGDGDADADDFFLFLDAFNSGDLGVCDVDGDGDCDGDDFFAYLDRFSQAC